MERITLEGASYPLHGSGAYEVTTLDGYVLLKPPSPAPHVALSVDNATQLANELRWAVRRIDGEIAEWSTPEGEVD